MSQSPARLPHLLDRDAYTVRAIVETPAGSKAKVAFDPQTGLYALSKILPAGLAMPLDFGFIPSTCGGDGDPLDIMLLSEAALPAGCLVDARILGAIEVEQCDRDGGNQAAERNDRIVARLTESRQWAHVDTLDQLGDGFTTELNAFFKSYKDLQGKRYDVLAIGGRDRAVELIAEAARAAGR